MRALLVTLACLSTVLALPVGAQAPPPVAPLLEDAAGDGVPSAYGNPLPPAGSWDALDLRALRWSEDPAGFRLEVQVEDLGEDAAQPDYGNINTRFAFAGADFSLNMYRSMDNGAYFGNLYRRAGEEAPYAFVRGLAVERDFAADTVWTTVDRFDLLGADGQAAGRGDAITGLRSITISNAVSSAGAYVMGQPVTRVGDAMPDAAGAGADWTVLYGGGEAQGARLSTPQPFRASNGEATAYQFTLTAAHDGQAARYRVFVENVPAGWNVTLPGGLLDLPEGKPLEFPLYLTTPFRHQHGTAESFQVHLHEEGGGRWASLDLGVHFLAVPQPAGHHPKVWLHSSPWSEQAEAINAPLGSTNGYLTMNTVEEDPSDARTPILGRSEVPGYNTGANVNSVGIARYSWSVCLEPSLRLGLDFDLARTGLLEVPVHTVRPLPGATLSGRLLHLGPGEPLAMCLPYAYAAREQTVLADVAGSTADLAANGQATFTATLTPRPEADYVPGVEGAGLVLELTLTGLGMPSGGTGGAYIDPGAWMELPLNEYHDAVAVTVPSGSVPAAGFVPEGGGAKDAPGAALPLLLGLLALAALARRHSST